MLSRRYQLLLLVIIVLAVFYPTNFAEVNSADDRDMLAGLQNLGDWSLYNLFFAHRSGGVGYYRPLLMLSFYLDKEIWSLSANIMHLENVLLHLMNSFFVFTFARLLLSENERQTSLSPLVAALCFALHPLAVEPVSWISGRTDVLAGLFVLMSAIALLKFKLEGKKVYGLLALASIALGMFSKEVALGFIPGAFLLLIARRQGQQEVLSATDNWTRFKTIGVSVLLAGGGGVLFFGLRSLVYTSTSPKISMTLKFMFNDLYHTLFVFFRAFGFYVKKLYWPFPLNFAILEVDPLYELLAIPLVLLCLWIVTRRTLLSATFIAGLFLIVPSFPIAFGQIAWTPYAERYVYVASAFVVIASVIYLRLLLKQYQYPLVVKYGTILFILLMGITTFQRNMITRTNFTLYADTVKKSPGFNIAWNELGDAYCQKNDLVNAEMCFKKASSIYSFSYDEMYDLNLAKVLFEQGKYEEAADVYDKIFKRGEKSKQALMHYEEFLQKRQSASSPQRVNPSSALDPS